MKILLINVPSRRGKGGFDLPIALLYVGGIIERCGHEAKIFDLYLGDFDLEIYDRRGNEIIGELIENYQPSIIGFSGIATSYGRTKKLSHYIENRYPEVLQIAGSCLSTVYELLLTKTKIDVVFHGETEISLPIFLKNIENKKPFYDTPGISYLSNKDIVKNDPAEQVKNLDEIPFPAYHLIDMSKYSQPIRERFDQMSDYLFSNESIYQDMLKRIGNNKLYLPILASKGCTNRCSFCYRYVIGIRRHSVNYVISHLKYLKMTYDIKVFCFGDECFNSSPAWVLEFCDALENEDLNILYMIGGARVDRMNEKILRRLKETGCLEINYGQESGSDIILKELNKGTSVHQNKEITSLTKSIGIGCPIQLVIGSPGETNRTISETIQFLKDVEAYKFSYNHLIALPGAPIWQFVINNRLVNDIEKYLDIVAERGGYAPIINLTRIPNRICRWWVYHMRKELTLYYYKKMGINYIYLPRALFYILLDKFVLLMPIWLFSFAKYISKRVKNTLKR